MYLLKTLKNIMIIPVLLTFITSEISCVNILYIDELVSPSHQIWNYKVVDALLERGHNVTLIGPKTIDIIEHPNYTMFEIEDAAKALLSTDLVNPENFLYFGFFQMFNAFNDYCSILCQNALNAPSLKELVDYPKDFKFDLVIYDFSLFGCLLPLIQKFSFPPSIAVSPFLLTPFASEIFGHVSNPSYQPHLFTKFSDQMSFSQRVANHFFFTYDSFMRKYYYKPKWTAQVREYFGQDTEDIDSLERRLSILLPNIMPGFHYPQPIPPNVIPVGGLHIKQSKELPKDLQDLMDNSENGVILFSLGTNIKVSMLTPSKVQMILRVLGRLKENVLWKTDTELENVPENVKILKWIPQNDILAHPNTKAFISHCGGLGSMETAYFGVPVIGLPFFVDQFYMAAQIEAQKLGKKLDYLTMTENDLYDTIQEVIQNPVYKENALEISAFLKDQQETPMERAIYWIEWSMRHDGSVLQHRFRDMPLFTRSCFDVYSFYLVVIVVFLTVLTKIISLTASMMTVKSTSSKVFKLKSR